MQSAELRPGRHFTRFFAGDAFDAARSRTAHTGPLDEAAACALADCVLQVGTPFGGLDVGPLEVDAFPTRFLEFVTTALGDERAAQKLFDGGVLDRLGAGRHFFGALPLRVVARQFTATTKQAARAQLRGGWDEDLLLMLESATLRASTHPEELLIFIPVWRAPVPASVEPSTAPPSEPGPEALLQWLEACLHAGASDVSLVIGQPPTLLGPRGVEPLRAPPLTARALDAALSPLLDTERRERLGRRGSLVSGFSVEGLGRFRVTVSSTTAGRSASIRSLRVSPALEALGWPAELLTSVRSVDRGLVVLAGPQGHGRSTLLAALLVEHARAGRQVLTLEEPAGHLGLPGVRQHEHEGGEALSSFRRLAHALPAGVVGIDLLDDAEALDLALELASRGLCAVVTQHALSTSASLHALAMVDAARHRRRLSESLEAVMTLRLLATKGSVVHAAELLRPTESLRRHLRGNESPAPPVLLETEGLGIDDRLLAAVRRGALEVETATRWLVDRRRIDELA